MKFQVQQSAPIGPTGLGARVVRDGTGSAVPREAVRAIQLLPEPRVGQLLAVPLEAGREAEADVRDRRPRRRESVQPPEHLHGVVGAGDLPQDDADPSVGDPDRPGLHRANPLGIAGEPSGTTFDSALAVEELAA